MCQLDEPLNESLGKTSARRCSLPSSCTERGPAMLVNAKHSRRISTLCKSAKTEGTRHTTEHGTHLCIAAELFKLLEGSVQGLVSFSQLSLLGCTLLLHGSQLGCMVSCLFLGRGQLLYQSLTLHKPM